MTGVITYTELVEKFGKDSAVGLLLCVERIARIKNDIIQFDRNARWSAALETLNEIDMVN